jgi:hypothetical protein
MVNPAVVSFWLDNKRVNGTSIAEDGPVKLVRYGSKLYVVEGKDAERRSYSQTSLPPKWKKILSAAKAASAAAGAAPATTVSAAAPAPAKPRQPSSEAKKANKSAPRVRKEQAETAPAAAPTLTAEPPASGDTESTSAAPVKRVAKIIPKPINQEVETDMSTEKEKTLVVDTTNNQTAEPKIKKAKAAAAAPAVETQPAPEPVVKAKTASKAGKAGKTRDKAGDLGCSCPYCQHKKDLTLADSELDKPVVVVCAGCDREFVLRVVMTYQVQVAGFI